MSSDILLLLACLPSIIYGYIVYKNDKLEKESSGLLIRLFVFGILSTCLTIILSILVGIFIPIIDVAANKNIFAVLIYAFVNVSCVEEFSKWIFLRLGTWNNKEFNHIYDAIVYAVFVSLGFATIENILYVLGNSAGVGGVFYGFVIAIRRALFSVPAHAFWGVLSGYYYGLSKQASINGNQQLMNKNMFLSIFVPIMSHGFFDFCLLTGNGYLVTIWLVFVVGLYIIAFKKIKIMSRIKVGFYDEFNENNDVVNKEPINVIVSEQKAKPKYCFNCGNLLTGKYCSNCGIRNE